MIKGRTVRINKPTSNKTKGKIEEENDKNKKRERERIIKAKKELRKIGVEG